MRLRDWKSAARDIEFDPESGAARIVALPVPRPKDTQLSGFACMERSVWGAPTVFAVYRVADGLRFSAGRQTWRLDDSDLVLTHTRCLPFLSKFCVIRSGRKEFSFTCFHFGRMLMASCDPTYDGIDYDQDYFLAFVAKNALSADWKRSACEKWICGASTASLS